MRVIGLELEGDRIKLAELEVSWKGTLNLVSCAEYRLEEIESSGSLRKEIGRADQVIVSYPGGLVSSRLLSLPFTQQKKIEQVLPYEVEPLFPFELDQVILSYHLISQEGGTSRILVAATPKEEFRRFIEKLHRYGIDPHQVEWDGMALYNFSRIAAEKEEGSALLIKIGAEQTFLCFVKEDLPLMIRSIGGGVKDLTEKRGWNRDHFLIKELFKTIQAFKSESGDSIQSLAIYGEGGEVSTLPEWISEELSIPLKRPVVDPGMLKIADTAPIDGHEIDPLFVAAVGLALKGSPLKGTLSQINFRKEEFSHVAVEKGKKGVQRTILVFSLVILFLGFVDLGIRFSIKKEHYEKISRQLQMEYRELFPGTGPVISEVEQTRGAMTQLKKREAFFDMKGLSPLEVLREMTVQIPKEVKIDVSELNIDPEKVRLEGETDSFDALDKIKDSLGKTHSFGDIVVVDSKMNAEESKVRFKLEMTRMAKEEKR